jgi:hypothetical protein
MALIWQADANILTAKGYEEEVSLPRISTRHTCETKNLRPCFVVGSLWNYGQTLSADEWKIGSTTNNMNWKL